MATLFTNNSVILRADLSIISITVMKKKQFYEKPSMKVFELKQQPQLLVGSGLSDPDDYGNGNDPFNP